MHFENNHYSVTKEANQISRIGMIGRGDIPPQRIETRQRYLFRSEIRSEGKYRCSQGNKSQRIKAIHRNLTNQRPNQQLLLCHDKEILGLRNKVKVIFSW